MIPILLLLIPPVHLCCQLRIGLPVQLLPPLYSLFKDQSNFEIVKLLFECSYFDYERAEGELLADFFDGELVVMEGTTLAYMITNLHNPPIILLHRIKAPQQLNKVPWIQKFDISVGTLHKWIVKHHTVLVKGTLVVEN